jgi:hypothetical protein
MLQQAACNKWIVGLILIKIYTDHTLVSLSANVRLSLIGRIDARPSRDLMYDVVHATYGTFCVSGFSRHCIL